MLEMRIINPSQSPWARSVTLVPKKDESTCFCIDYRQVNNVTIKDMYPLPLIQDILDQIGETKVFSTQPQTKFVLLGYVISADGVFAQPLKMEAVRALNTPINVTELRHFLGMTGYYRQLIANYAQLALPHDELTHDGQQGQWGSAEQNAFQQLRLVLCEAPVMAHP